MSKRIAIGSAAVLCGTLAIGGVANAASGTPHHKGDQSHSQTVKRSADVEHIPAGKVSANKDAGDSKGDKSSKDDIAPASPSNPYSQTVKMPVGTDAIPGHPVK
ncbi:hypothetical protein [Streptomyces sp. NPDC059009]|uniref:hypothetical protein n=1 Tax=Streptomyces sp. NPDC059009 TaxID=3346694 RepID=UPI0036B3B2EB